MGREVVDSTNSSLIVNGGSLSVTNTPAGGAFIVGAANDGVFRLNGGTVSVQDAPLWVSDGGNRAGTVVQTGGSFSLGTGDVILSRAGASNGHYQMSGGTLSANSIIPGTGNTPVFLFQGGEIRLTGDQRALVDEPWFHPTGVVTSNYDGSTDTTTLKAVPQAGKTATWQYYRFTANRLRDGFATAVQLSEFEFLKDGASVSRTNVTVTNPGGESPGGEVPENLLDGLDTTKWLDALNQPVVFDFGAPTAIDGYRFTTGNDASGRDPLRWTLEGSADGVSWTAIDRVTSDAPVPQGRRISLLDQPLPQTVPAPPEPAASLVWSGAQSADWNTAQLNWTADGGPVAWSNTKPLEAVFSTPGPKAVRLSAPATANSLNFTAPGYTVTGTETLTLAEPALITGTADASIAVPITGTAGLRREGTGNTVFTGPLSHTGLTALTSGTVTLAEGSSSTGNGNLVLADPANSRAVLNIDGSGEYNFSGSVRVGRGDLSAAAIVQTEGTVTVGGSGVEYLQ
ncbi:MAG: discoidin domain-containing protein, partial [Verrucomicrobiaceae bacterium]